MKYLFLVFALQPTLWAASNTIYDDPARSQNGTLIPYGLDGMGSQLSHGILRYERILPKPELNPWSDLQNYAWSAVWSGSQNEDTLDIPTAREPQLKATYSKTPMNGLFFQAQFKRNLWGPWNIGLKTQSSKSDLTQNFEYQNSTHQPFLSLGRDSLSLPLNGRHLHFQHFGWSPELEWNFGPEWQGQLQYLSWSHDLDLPYIENPSYSLSDPNLTRIFAHSPYRLQNQVQTWQQIHQGTFEKWHWQNTQLWSQSMIKQTQMPKWILLYPGIDSLKTRDSLSDSLSRIYQTLSFSRALGHVQLEIKGNQQWTWLNLIPKELSTSGQLLQEDRQNASIELKSADSLNLNWEGEIGVQRYSTPLSQRFYAPMARLKSMAKIWGSTQTLQGSMNTRFPNTSDYLPSQYVDMQLDNPELKSAQSWQLEYQTLWKWGRLGLNTEILGRLVQNPMVPWGAYWGERNYYLLEPFDRVNLDYEQAYHYQIGIQFPWKHWNLNVQRQAKISHILEYQGIAHSRSDVPGVLWQGSAHWRDTLLHKKSLDLELRFDWRYFGNYVDYSAMYNKGLSTSYQVPAELMLDFEARAHIQSFQLFAQIRNLAHEYLHSVSGYTTPGLHLQWGITWDFDS